MNIGSMQASSTGLASIGSPAGATAGSAAERAHRAAVKDLAEAQKKLTQDMASGASKEIIELDKAAVEMAAAAVAAAAMAVAREKEQAQQKQVESRPTSPGQRTSSEGISASAVAAIVSSAAALDLYA